MIYQKPDDQKNTKHNEKLLIHVDENDVEIGTGGKSGMHAKGILHRAFSVYIFNKKNQMLLQQRAIAKYHSGGLWSNTCCSHPAPGEDIKLAAERRLKEEMGLDCDIRWLFKYRYKEQFEENLYEHEIVHVYTGFSEDDPVPDPLEVAEFKWQNINVLQRDMEERPELYTVWFRIAFNEVVSYL